MEIFGIIIGSVGAGLIGASLMSLVLECSGLRDYRLYVGAAGFLIALLGMAVLKW